VRTGGGYIQLDRFIEVMAPLEEAKIIRAQSITDKYKGNAVGKKAISSEKTQNSPISSNLNGTGKVGSSSSQKKK
jgi:hypothetical protein